MAHCGSCMSNLGTGGKKGTGDLYGVQGTVVRTGRATTRNVNVSPWVTTHGDLIRSNGKINKQAWVPASSGERPSGLIVWAYFPGGRKANLSINGSTQTRYVLGHKNGGPTGLLVRLGEIARELGTGGCGDLTGLPGTGGVPSVNMRSGATWRGTGLKKGSYSWKVHPSTGGVSDGVHGLALESRAKKQVANRWFPATYGGQPSGSPESWIVLLGPIPGPAELWMSGSGPLHKHDVEVIQLKTTKNKGQFTALVAGWSLPHMINDVTIGQTGNRRVSMTRIASTYPNTGGRYAPGTAGALLPQGPVYLTMNGVMDE